MTAVETVREAGRLFLPIWGYELKESRAERAPCDPHVFVDGECRGCHLRNDGGVLRYGEDIAECESHMIEDGECTRCGGREILPGVVTRPSPRILGRCEHARHVPFEGQLKCLDCGSVGM
jgi:hypothetical protein